VRSAYNVRMFALRYGCVLALVVWLGGMVILGALVSLAPTIFRVFQERHADAGRVLAGAVGLMLINIAGGLLVLYREARP
jgi:hypothetical protein